MGENVFQNQWNNVNWLQFYKIHIPSHMKVLSEKEDVIGCNFCTQFFTATSWRKLYIPACWHVTCSDLLLELGPKKSECKWPVPIHSQSFTGHHSSIISLFLPPCPRWGLLLQLGSLSEIQSWPWNRATTNMYCGKSNKRLFFSATEISEVPSIHLLRQHNLGKVY